MQHNQYDLTNDLVTEALFAGRGILADAAGHLSDRLGRPVSRPEVAKRVEASRVLSAVQVIARQTAFEEAIEAAAGSPTSIEEKRPHTIRPAIVALASHANCKSGSLPGAAD